MRVDSLHVTMLSNRMFNAIFPKIAILNHSCDPNTRHSFDGPFVSINALRDIAKNEEIYFCYGPNYKVAHKALRQSALIKSYRFKCECSKCIIEDETHKKYYEYICPNKLCRTPLKLDLVKWWVCLDDKEFVDSITTKFVCKTCNRRLLLNPNSLRKFVHLCTEVIDSGCRSDATNEMVLRYYANVSKCLGNYHDLKMEMAKTLLCGQMRSKWKCNEEICRWLTPPSPPI